MEGESRGLQNTTETADGNLWLEEQTVVYHF